MYQEKCEINPISSCNEEVSKNDNHDVIINL